MAGVIFPRSTPLGSTGPSPTRMTIDAGLPVPHHRGSAGLKVLQPSDLRAALSRSFAGLKDSRHQDDAVLPEPPALISALAAATAARDAAVLVLATAYSADAAAISSLLAALDRLTATQAGVIS